MAGGDRPGTAGGGGPSAAAIDALNEAAFHSYKDALAKCEHCGRSFNADRLVIHHRSCTADNPARRVGERLPGGGGMPTGAARSSGDSDDDGAEEEHARSSSRAHSRSATRPGATGRPGTAPSPAAGGSARVPTEPATPHAPAAGEYARSPARPTTASSGMPQLSSMGASRTTVPVGAPTPAPGGVSPLQRRSVGPGGETTASTRLPTIPPSAGGAAPRAAGGAAPTREEMVTRMHALKSRMQDVARDFERAFADITREMQELADVVQALPEDGAAAGGR